MLWDVYIPDGHYYWKKISGHSTQEAAEDYCRTKGYTFTVEW